MRSLLCFLGYHEPSQQSIARNKRGQDVALCTHCAVPLLRASPRRWSPATPAGS